MRRPCRTGPVAEEVREAVVGVAREAKRGGTVVAAPWWIILLAWVALPALGAAAGWLLLPAADLLASLRWVPLRGPIELFTSLPRAQARLGATAVGLFGGLLLAFAVVHDSLRVVIGDDLAVLARRGESARVPRAEAGAVFLDGERLVVLDRAGRELAREPCDLGREAMAAAFRGHGWPWRDDGDPYRDDYRRWVPGLPGLPPGAGALLQARERALGRRDAEDAAALRSELGRLGVVVRDTKRHQHWRLTARPGE